MTGVLNRYLVRRFTIWLAITGTAFGAVAILGTFLEMLRFANRFNLGAAEAFYFTMLRLPLLLIDFLPFIFLFSTVFCLLRLSAARELAVIRAAGVSVWQFLMPIMVFTFILASLIVAVVEPLGTANFRAFTAIEAELTGIKQRLSFSTGGVWFRQAGATDSYIMRADRLDERNRNRLVDVDVIVFDRLGDFSHHLRADDAILSPGAFMLKNAALLKTNETPEIIPLLSLATNLQPESLRQGFIPAQAVSIWQLPGYIAEAGRTGIDVTRHQVRFQSLLALPLLLMAMVMVAACFSLPTGRMVSTGQTLGLAVLCGFLLFLFNDFIHLLGDLGTVPPALSSWAPVFIAMFLAISYLLLIEDG